MTDREKLAALFERGYGDVLKHLIMGSIGIGVVAGIVFAAAVAQVLRWWFS